MSKNQNSAATSKRPRRFPRSESEFLDHKADAAKAALSNAARETAGAILNDLDPRAWTRKHPWASVGVVAAAGFVAGTQAGKPSLKPSSKTNTEESPPPASQHPPAGPSSLLGLLVAAGLDILKSALVPVVAGEVASRLNRRE